MPNPTTEQLVIEILGNSKDYVKEINKVKRENRTLEDSFEKVNKAAKVSFAAAGSAAIAMGTVAAKAFMRFETGLTNVAKTTNLVGKDLEDFKNEIIDMSEEMPVTTDRLLEIATAAGQLGIKGVPNLTKFTETIAKLGATTNVEGEQAALTIARIQNITGEATDTVDQFGDSLVHLGNNFATTESEILEMAGEVAKSTVQFKLSSQQILGMSAAMTALGMEAESGSTVVGKAFQAIDNAVSQQGGPAFDKLIQLTGMTGDEITKVFLEDSSKAFQMFILGLSKAAKQGEVTTKELDAFGLSGIRIDKILPTLASRSDVLAEALEKTSDSAGSLNKEFAMFADTTASKATIALNKFNNALIIAGEEISKNAVDGLNEAADAATQSSKAWELLGSVIGFVAKIAGNSIRLLSEIFDWDPQTFGAAIARENVQLEKMLKERGITLEEFRKEQEKLRSKQAAKSINAITEEETKKTDVEAQQAARRAKIKEDEYKTKAELDTQYYQQLRQQGQQSDEERIARAIETSNRISEQRRNANQLEIEENRTQHERKTEQTAKANDKEYDSWEEFYAKLQDAQEKHGAVIGTMNALLNDKRYNDTKMGMQALSVLIESEHKEQKEIGKAATLVQMGMSTAEAAMKAFNGLAWIPYVGWALGGIAAAAVAGYGLSQMNEVRQMKEGGVVPGVGTGDKVPALLEPGELVVPRALTKEIINDYEGRRMADGGKVAGDKEKTGLHQTFADIFKVPQVFKQIIAGDEPDSSLSGFGADSFVGMVPKMLVAIEEAANELKYESMRAQPGGDALVKAQKVLDKSDSEIRKVLGDNSVIRELKNVLGEETVYNMFGGSSKLDEITDSLQETIDKHVQNFFRNFFGFKNGGMPAMLEPGESTLPKSALSAIANSINMSQNISAMSSRPSISRSKSARATGIQKQIVEVEISMNDNAAEIINAQIREGSELGTIIPA